MGNWLDQAQRMAINGTESSCQTANSSIPQGSTLRQISFFVIIRNPGNNLGEWSVHRGRGALQRDFDRLQKYTEVSREVQ